MVFFEETTLYERKKFLDLPVILVIIVVGGFLGYYLGQKVGQMYPQIIQELPAQLRIPLTGEKITEIVRETSEIPPENEIPITVTQSYLETAESGEGITHLARKALKTYLQTNPQSFQITAEHKVYIEDYIAKKLGGNLLQLGEKMEFSPQLLQEALGQAQNLTPAQLQNLTQYSQLIFGLNY